MTNPKQLRAIVIGGSLGGLTAALVLRDIGCDVRVFERSNRPLMGRGLGIVAHPATVRYPTSRGLADLAATSALAPWVRYVDRTGKITHELPSGYRFTSYFALYETLLDAFDSCRYHLRSEVVGFKQDDDGVTVELAHGRRERCDLLVCADGIHSASRRRLLPEVERQYAGYVAWRGAVSESELSSKSFGALHEAITYFLMHSSHILAYPIPNLEGSLEPGSRYINWIWYRNLPSGPELDDLLTDADGNRHSTSVPPGRVRGPHQRDLRDQALTDLPPQLAETVAKTAEPFVQVVFDLEVPRLAFGRICLLGDAACVLRPHAAVGTAKAAESAWRLAEAIEAASFDPVEALRDWEPAQLELESGAVSRTREAGIRSQFENSWQPGEGLPFGLYEAGDSALEVPGEQPA